MRELRPRLSHWEAPHPQWRATEPWSENVSSYAIDDGPGHKANDSVLWVESQRAVISEGLRPVLALPVEHVLATHGGPTNRAALEHTLSST